MRFLYTCIVTLALPIILAQLWWKERKVPGYRKRIAERFGYFRPPEKNDNPFIWIHAVSVGEVVAATPLIKQLLERYAINIVVTTTTPTGSARVYKNFGQRIFHVYTPFDIPFVIRSFLKRVNPIAFITIETELWPNTLHFCQKMQIPTLVANARLSDRSTQKYIRFKQLSAELMNNLSAVAAQTIKDGENYQRLGLSNDKLVITGSIKFDVIVDTALKAQAKALKRHYSIDGLRPIWIAGSTHSGEESILLDAFKIALKKHPNLLLIIVPRHPANFSPVEALCREKALTCLRRSSAIIPNNKTQIVLGDTMGELLLLYGLADFAFIGGSLIERGGHNMIEAAVWKIPIMSGPHVFNFNDIADQLFKKGGLRFVDDKHEIANYCDEWICNPATRHTMGEKAWHYVNASRGPLLRLLDMIDQHVGDKL